MKNYQLSAFFLAASALTFTACSSDDGDDSMNEYLAENPVEANIVASISDGEAVTRVSVDNSDSPSTDAETTFAANDVIHIVASTDATKTYDYTYSGSAWSSTAPYYFTSTDAVSFKAWYSTLTPGDGSTSITVNTAEQTATSGYNSCDILVAPASTASTVSSATVSASTASASYSSPSVKFTKEGEGDDNRFQHIMSKMTFTFKAGTDNGISNLNALSGYTVKSLTYTQATFNTLTCELTKTESTSADITQTVSATSDATEYTCTPIILIPQDVDSDNTSEADGKFTLQVTYNSQTYAATLQLPDSKTALEAGKHYTYTVTIKNGALEVSEAKIANWETAAGTAADATLVTTE